MRTPSCENSREPVEQGLLAKALATAADPIFITDRTGGIVWVNAAFSERSGFSPQEAVGQTPSFLNSGRHDASFYLDLWQTILAGRVWRGEVVERRKDGSLYTVDEVITPLRDEKATVTHFVAIQRDISLRKQETEREHFLAYHDALTGLYNRVLFLDLLQQAIARSRHSLHPLALLYLDIDNFKLINDTFGRLAHSLHRRQQHGGDESHPADPQHHAEYVPHARNNGSLHGSYRVFSAAMAVISASIIRTTSSAMRSTSRRFAEGNSLGPYWARRCAASS